MVPPQCFPRRMELFLILFDWRDGIERDGSIMCLVGGMGCNQYFFEDFCFEEWDGINMVQGAPCIEIARLPLAFANLHMYKFQQQLICIVSNIYSVFQKQ